MTDYLEFSIDKFTFRTATDQFYNDEGVWAKPEYNKIKLEFLITCNNVAEM